MAGAAAVFRLAAPVVANSVANGFFVLFSLKAGVAAGALVDAAIQTYLLDLVREAVSTGC